MKLNILIVDGNDKESSDDLISAKIEPQYITYRNVLEKLSPNDFNISIIHPAISDEYFPKNFNLDDYHGVVWTGSVLNIYDDKPSIYRQIELAKILLQKKNKIFGSCWGLQVLATAAGGYVNKNLNGLEAIIAKNIKITEKGKNHEIYKKKINNFDSLCWHYDEIKKIPENSEILSFNEHSKIQGLTFKTKFSEFWGVQYHPEFTTYWMSQLMLLRKKILLKNKMYKNHQEFNRIHASLKNNNSDDIHLNIINFNNHSLELKNWLEYLKVSN